MIRFAPEPSGQIIGAMWRSLLVTDWNDSQGALRLNAHLAPAELAGSSFHKNARILLSALTESKGIPATATGNLNRAFVREMFNRITLPALTRESMLRHYKVLNETDVWALHVVRIVCECAGLLSRRKKQFQLTRAGHSLLCEEKAGELFHKLFIAYFRKFDLHYDFNLRYVPGIQETLAVILWRIDTVARDWVPVTGLAPQVLLAGVLDQMHGAMRSSYDKEEWILSGYVLKPLLDLGLIEKRTAGDWPGIDEKDSIRVTALWKHFISFHRVS